MIPLFMVCLATACLNCEPRLNNRNRYYYGASLAFLDDCLENLKRNLGQVQVYPRGVRKPRPPRTYPTKLTRYDPEVGAKIRSCVARLPYPYR